MAACLVKYSLSEELDKEKTQPGSREKKITEKKPNSHAHKIIAE